MEKLPTGVLAETDETSAGLKTSPPKMSGRGLWGGWVPGLYGNASYLDLSGQPFSWLRKTSYLPHVSCPIGANTSHL